LKDTEIITEMRDQRKIQQAIDSGKIWIIDRRYARNV
jgi:hypothetical protein